MLSEQRMKIAIVAYLEGALQLANELRDGKIGYLIERALDQARSAQAHAVERAGTTTH